ncbi:MAG: stage III sporulation protein AD [Agathobacter sp.]|nr:stage III sporulation protein AD [Agathobacter sp.]
MIKIGLVGIVAAFLGLYIRKERPEFGILIGIFAGVFIFTYGVAQIEVIVGFVEKIMGYLPVKQEYLWAILKMLGIAYVAEFASTICKDSGYSSIGGQIEMFARLSIVVLSLPGLSYLLDVVEELL